MEMKNQEKKNTRVRCSVIKKKIQQLWHTISIANSINIV